MSLLPILADVVFSPFDLAWSFAATFWPVIVLIVAVIVVTVILIRRRRKK